MSAWDTCYDAKVRLFRETGKLADGTPNLAYRGAVEGVSGLVSVVPDGDIFHLLSTSRSRRSLAPVRECRRVRGTAVRGAGDPRTRDRLAAAVECAVGQARFWPG
jgi:hypothetical protein